MMPAALLDLEGRVVCFRAQKERPLGASSSLFS
jgi:hypothetical protein